MPQNVSDATKNVIKVRIDGEIAYIGLNRPEKRNAINTDVLRALPEALAEVDRREIRAVILYGEGAAFSAGIDFTSLASDTGSQGGSGGGPDLVRFRRFVHASQASLDAIERLEKPVIGALHGYVGGLGLEIALACDARIAAVGTKLGMPETRIGLVPDVGGTTRLTRTVGYARAKELIMTARMIDADEAARLGLVNRVVAEGAHIAAAEELAREIARNAPLAVGLAKRIIDIGASTDKSTFMELEALAQSSLFQTEDFREGATALAQRRDPKFKGR
jgi:enoyl-CoA hydratase/carnithine racemase